ncbi:protein of unknown function (plasmid) [Caballeronia sp. S22]
MPAPICLDQLDYGLLHPPWDKCPPSAPFSRSPRERTSQLLDGAEMIEMTVVLVLLGGALVVYLNGQNGDDGVWEKWERELRDTREDR